MYDDVLVDRDISSLYTRYYTIDSRVLSITRFERYELEKKILIIIRFFFFNIFLQPSNVIFVTEKKQKIYINIYIYTNIVCIILSPVSRRRCPHDVSPAWRSAVAASSNNFRPPKQSRSYIYFFALRFSFENVADV